MIAELDLVQVPAGSTTSLKNHLTQVWKQTGKKPQQLESQPDFPDELGYIWNHYLSVRGASQLTWLELNSWVSLTQPDLRGWEAELIKKLDGLFWGASNG